MPEYRDQIKAEPLLDVVFVCEQSLLAAERTQFPIVAWHSDPDVPDSIQQFLADAEIRGWPILIHGATAYVYATNVGGGA